MIKRLLYICILLISIPAYAQIRTGLKVYKEFDTARIFDTLPSSPMHKRPVKIDLFYPSTEIANKSPFSFGDFLNMYSERMNYHISRDSAARVSADLAKMFAEYVKLDSAGQYIEYTTSIYPDLALPAKKYPLIIYAAGMNGSSWENIVMFDSLCKAGYVVAAISSVGLFPGFMSTGPDITEQVKDILFVKDKMVTMPFIDRNNIGLMSWSLGGSAVSKAAMLSKDFKCIVSFDGTEIHHYGVDSAWDKQFEEMIALEPSDPSRINIPYLYIGSNRPKPAKMYNIFDHINTKDKYFAKITDGTHEDFSSIITIANDIKPHRKGSDPGISDNIWHLTRIFFDRYLTGKTYADIQEVIDRLN
jgi:dienelactone hydrolase